MVFKNLSAREFYESKKLDSSEVLCFQRNQGRNFKELGIEKFNSNC